MPVDESKRKYERHLLQNMIEWEAFMNLAKAENVRSYLEIGCKFGGTLWRMGMSLPTGSRVVGVDLPHGDASFKETLPHLRDCVAELRRRGYDSHLIVGDSTDQKTVEQASALGPYDLCFIDANHTYPYVKKDWENYGAMSRIVGFHDINFMRPVGQRPQDHGKMPIEAPRLWSEIKDKFKHAEIKHDGNNDNGIGVLWRNQ